MVSLLIAGALASLLIGLGSSPAVAASSSLSIRGFSPSSGPVGRSVKITGSGFLKGDVVEFGGTRATKVSVAAGGNSITTAVPAFAPSGPITVIDPVGIAARSKAPFRVTRGIFATPRRVWPGLPTTIEGSDFPADTSVKITANGSPLLHAESNRDGDFAVRYVVPTRKRPQLITLSVLDFVKVPPIHLVILADWPQFHHDPNHSGLDPFDFFLTKSHVTSGLKPLLALPLGTTSSEVAVSEGLAWVVSSNGKTGSNLFEINLTTKKIAWESVTIGWNGDSTPAVAGGVVYVGTSDDHVYAFPTSCSTPCQPTWTSQTAGGKFVGSPTVYNGDVYIGASDSRVYAYPATCSATCTPLWVSKATGGPIYDSPAIAGDTLYVGSNDDKLYAFPVLCSTPCAAQWISQPTGGAMEEASPALDGSTVFTGSSDGKLYAFPTKCMTPCAPTWVSTPMDGPVSGTPSVYGGRVYVGGGRVVYGYPETCSYPCSPVWKTEAAPTVYQSPELADGVLYINDIPFDSSGGLIGGRLSAFDTTDTACSPSCAPIWQSPAGLTLGYADAAVAGSVFITASDGKLYSFG